MDKVTQADRALMSAIHRQTAGGPTGAKYYETADPNEAIELSLIAKHRLSVLSDDKVTDEVVEAALVAWRRSYDAKDYENETNVAEFARNTVKSAILAALAVIRGEV